MNLEVYREISLGDMTARYLRDRETGQVELQLLPQDMAAVSESDRLRKALHNVVQAHLTGEGQPGTYGGGVTLLQSGTTRSLCLEGLDCRTENGGVQVIADFIHPTGCRFRHHLEWDGHRPILTSWSEAENRGESDVSLELLTSFSLGGMTPLLPDAAPGALRLHRLRSAWSMEGRLCSETLERLNLEPSWARHGVRCERFGQVGSMPVNGWFPWMILEDVPNQVYWGCQLAHNGSWQMEVTRLDDTVSLSGGQADYAYGHWRKTLAPGQRFETPRAFLTVCRAQNVDQVAGRMVTAMDAAIPKGPLPLFFNEYCTTWGVPSEASVADQLAVLEGKGFTHFVMDAGWYKPDDLPWDDALGDYEVSKVLFPSGMEKTVAAIREAGMIPGIWFEPETVGKTSRAYGQEDHLLKRDGAVITTPTRRFWDLCDPWVQQYLEERVIRFLHRYGFGYVKLDYNETIGLGCDGAESLGEGLRRQMAAVIGFLRRLREQVPGIQVELCASGGHRLEPSMLTEVSFASFSDAHECVAIPIVAANLHRVMQPAQSQIWAVVRKEDSLRRLGYSLCAAMLGSMCISGDVCELSPEQWDAVEKGLAFYRSVSECIRRGVSRRFGPEVLSYNSPEGWQGVLRTGEQGKTLAVLHRFGGDWTEPIRIPWEGGAIESVYDCCGSRIWLESGALCWEPREPMSSAAVLLG